MENETLREPPAGFGVGRAMAMEEDEGVDQVPAADDVDNFLIEKADVCCCGDDGDTEVSTAASCRRRCIGS